MMIKKQLICLALVFFCIPYFAIASNLTQYRWNPKFPELSPLTKWSIGDVYSLPKIKGHREYIRHGSQTLGQAKLAGTWMQHVETEDGDVLFAAGSYYPNLPRELLPKINAMGENAINAANLLKAMDPELSEASRVFPAKLELAFDENRQKFVLYWLVEYVDSGQNGFFYVKADEHLHIFARGSTGTAADGEGRVYPAGPVRSVVTTETLPGLSGDGTLSGLNMQVQSALSVQAIAPNLQFVFPTEDPRFSQVQVYFYVNEAIRWFQGKFGAELPSPSMCKCKSGTTE